MPKLKKGQAKVLSEEEFKRLLKVISVSKYSKRDTLLIYMSFGLGLRVMELAALKIKNVFSSESKILEEISLPKTKGDYHRVVYLTDKKIRIILKEYLIERKEFHLDDPLFLSKQNKPFSSTTLQKRFENLYKLSGIEGASSHSGRRTFATRLIQEGADIKSISTLMGHKSIVMTSKYMDSNPIRLKNIITKALY